MVEVVWTDDALNDLLGRASDRDVAHQILHVARTELQYHFPPDGGFGRHPLLWRRAITQAQRREVDRATAAGRDHDGGDVRPWQFLIVFRKMGARELGRKRHDGFMVIAVLRDGHIAAGYEEIIETAMPTRFGI
jgi:hypothetical protein